MSELTYRVRKYFNFNKKERRDILYIILAMAVIFGFDDGRETFNLIPWLFNLAQILIMVAIGVLAHLTVQKIVALHMGFVAEFKAWPTGIFIGLIVAFLSGGAIPIILPGTMIFAHHSILRLGHFRYGLNVATQSGSLLAGPVANLVVATIAKTIALIGIFPTFFDTMAVINLVYMVFSLLPIPNNDGITIFFASRMVYISIASVLIWYVILYLAGIFSWLIAIILALLTVAGYYFTFEAKL